MAKTEAERLCRINCEVVDGLMPLERIARVKSADGPIEEVPVSDQLIVNNTLLAAEVGRDGDDRVLIELPRESVSGRWRIWVGAGQLLKGITMNETEQQWREQWAKYFDERAEKSLGNARANEPDQAKVKAWIDVAAGERACAWAMRSGMSVAELIAALHPYRPT